MTGLPIPIQYFLDYQTSEHWVGKWYDGSDLYAMTFTNMVVHKIGQTENIYTTIPNANIPSSVKNDHTKLKGVSFHRLWKTNGTIACGNGLCRAMLWASGTSDIEIYFIEALTYTNFSGHYGEATIFYTK